MTVTDFKTTEKRFLVLENDSSCDDRTDTFINCVTFKADALPVHSGEVEYLFGLKYRMLEEIIEAIRRADVVVFESTFLDGQQIEDMIKVFASVKEPKEIISIHSELPYGIPKGCEHHTIYRCPDGLPHEMYLVD